MTTDSPLKDNTLYLLEKLDLNLIKKTIRENIKNPEILFTLCKALFIDGYNTGFAEGYEEGNEDAYLDILSEEDGVNPDLFYDEDELVSVEPGEEE